MTEEGFGVCVWPQIYTDWANHYLAKSGHKRLIKDLQTDVTDGVLLAEIIQVVGKITFISLENCPTETCSFHVMGMKKAEAAPQREVADF